MYLIIQPSSLARKNRNRRKIPSRRGNRRGRARASERSDKTSPQSSPNNKQITKNCFLNRKNQISCNHKNKIEWRQNFDEAESLRDQYKQKLKNIDRVIKKLKESKDRKIFKQTFIPCKCLPETHFKKEMEEKKQKYKEGKFKNKLN